MQKFLQAIWVVTLLIFVLVLFYVYAGINEQITFSGNMTVLGQLERDQFFYGVVGLFALTNALLFIFAQLLMKINTRESATLETFSGWLFGFAGGINFFYMFSLLAILFMQSSIPSYYYLAYVGPVILGIWVLVLPILLIRVRIS